MAANKSMVSALAQAVEYLNRAHREASSEVSSKTLVESDIRSAMSILGGVARESKLIQSFTTLTGLVNTFGFGVVGLAKTATQAERPLFYISPGGMHRLEMKGGDVFITAKPMTASEIGHVDTQALSTLKMDAAKFKLAAL